MAKKHTCSADKDIRKQLMDKILAAILQIVQMEENLNRDKDIVKEMNEFLQWNDGKVKEHGSAARAVQCERQSNRGT